MAQWQNVTRWQATAAAIAGMTQEHRQAFIWFDNNRDGWRWDFEGSAWLGHRTEKEPTKKIVAVKKRNRIKA